MAGSFSEFNRFEVSTGGGPHPRYPISLKFRPYPRIEHSSLPFLDPPVDDPDQPRNSIPHRSPSQTFSRGEGWGEKYPAENFRQILASTLDCRVTISKLP